MTETWKTRDGKQELKVKAIGDSVILAVETANSGPSEFEPPGMIIPKLYNLCFAVAELQSGLAANDIWSRGAITHDSVEITDTRIVGPAFHNAIKLESEIAKFPRVILDGRIIEVGGFSTAHEMVAAINAHRPQTPVLFDYWTKLPIPDRLPHDVPTFVDFLRVPYNGATHSEVAKSIVPQIAKRLRENVEHFSKYKWVAEYLRVSILRSQYEPGPLRWLERELELLNQS